MRVTLNGNLHMSRQIVHSNPEILGGTPVFVGTRVPVKNLFDYLEGGETLDEFLRQFPSVRRAQKNWLHCCAKQGSRRFMSVNINAPDAQRIPWRNCWACQ